MEKSLGFARNRFTNVRRKRRGGVLKAFTAIALLCSVFPLAGWDTTKDRFESPETCDRSQPFRPMGEISWELLSDARTVWEPGDSVRFEDGWGTQIRDGVPIREFAVDRLSSEGEGFRLLDATIDDLGAMVKEEPLHCNFETQGFSCHVGNYYCACYYGDPDGEGAGCHCAHDGSSDDD